MQYFHHALLCMPWNIRELESPNHTLFFLITSTTTQTHHLIYNHKLRHWLTITLHIDLPICQHFSPVLGIIVISYYWCDNYRWLWKVKKNAGVRSVLKSSNLLLVNWCQVWRTVKKMTRCQFPKSIGSFLTISLC